MEVLARCRPLWLFSEFGAVYKYSDLLTYLLTYLVLVMQLMCVCAVRTWVVAATRTQEAATFSAVTRPTKRWFCTIRVRAPWPMTSRCRRHRWRHTTWSASCCDDSSRTDSASICSTVNRPASLFSLSEIHSVSLSLSLSLFSFSSCPSFGDFILQIKPVSNQNSVQNSV